MAGRDVLIVLFDGVQSLDVAGPLEVLAGANQWRAVHGGPPFYRLRTASLGGDPVRTSSGLMLTPDRHLRHERPGGILLVPGGEASRSPSPDLVAWLGEHAPEAAELISVCTGAFLPETMRQAFLRALGVGPAEYRRRFHPGPSSARRPHQGQPARKESHGHRHSAV